MNSDMAILVTLVGAFAEVFERAFSERRKAASASVCSAACFSRAVANASCAESESLRSILGGVYPIPPPGVRYALVARAKLPNPRP